MYPQDYLPADVITETTKECRVALLFVLLVAALVFSGPSSCVSGVSGWRAPMYFFFWREVHVDTTYMPALHAWEERA